MPVAEPVLGRPLRDAHRPVRPPLVDCQPHRGSLPHGPARSGPQSWSQAARSPHDTRARCRAVTILVAFVAANVFAALIHGYILGRRLSAVRRHAAAANGDGAPSWQMAFLPVVHLAVVASLVWTYGRLGLVGSTLARALKVGLLLWTMGQLPVLAALVRRAAVARQFSCSSSSGLSSCRRWSSA